MYRSLHFLIIQLCVTLLFLGSIDVAQAARGNVSTSSSVKQDIGLPAVKNDDCFDPDPADSDTSCPNGDTSQEHQSPGQGGVTVPQPDGNGFSFSGLCSLTGPKTNNICLEVVDCLENSGKCAITECLQKPSLEECKQLCTSDPTNTACAAFDCAAQIDETCCAVVKIPECCDFFDLIDTFNICRKSPGAECCAAIGDFGGDTEFAERCANIVNCLDKADETCCRLFPDSSRDCKNIMGCLGLASDSPPDRLDDCCKLFPYDAVCDAHDCLKRIANGKGYGCCEFIDGLADGNPCETFFNCKNTLQSGSLISPAAQACCNSFVDLQSCQALRCIELIGREQADGVLLSGGGSLQYCCALTPSSETCQKFVNCFKEPEWGAGTCCELFSIGDIPACAFETCFSTFGTDASDSAPFPDTACCEAIPNIPKCEGVLKCLSAPTSECCALISSAGPTIGAACTALFGCITAVTTPSSTFASKASCCNIYPHETNDTTFHNWCRDFFYCEREPNIACCAFGSQYHDSNTCDRFNACVADPTVQCCRRFANLRNTPECEWLLECNRKPTYTCCIDPRMHGVQICADLLKCWTNHDIACCRVFFDISTTCEDAVRCHQNLKESTNHNNACCNTVLAAGVDFPKCASLVACMASLGGGTATRECCELLPGDTAWSTICEALFTTGTPIDWNGCDNPDVFGGCHCSPNSPGGSNNHDTTLY